VSRSPSAANVFHAIADENRRALIDFLARGEAPVGAVVKHSGMSYSGVSQHLAVLLEVGLVQRREEGRQRLYRLDPEPLRVVHDWTGLYEHFWRSNLSRLRNVLDEKKR
jgi:DNA-binding transcriptional ArsR family regulator